MTKDVSPPKVQPSSHDIKQLLKRKVEGRKESAATTSTTVPIPVVEIKKETDKPSRRRPEPAKIPRKTVAARQKVQQQIRVPAEAIPNDAPPTPSYSNTQQIFQEQEKTPIKTPRTMVPVPEMRSPSIEMVSPAPSSTADDNMVLSPPQVPNEFYQFPHQQHFVESSQAEIHPISISYAANEPVLKNIPNTMILPMEQSYEQAIDTFDEGTRESVYSNEVSEGEDGVNFLNNMFAGISNQNSNEYSSTDDEDDGDIQHFDYGEEDFYDNSRGVEYTIQEIEESKPPVSKPIILEEKILADNEKFSADWVDKIVKTEVKTEPEGYHAFVQQEPMVPIATSSKTMRKQVVGEFFFC